MECGCRQLPSGEGRGASSRDGKACDLWLAGKCGGENHSAGGSEAEGCKKLHVDRQTDAETGHAVENERERTVWLGCELAGNADRGGGKASGIWREGGEA